MGNPWKIMGKMVKIMGKMGKIMGKMVEFGENHGEELLQDGESWKLQWITMNWWLKQMGPHESGTHQLGLWTTYVSWDDPRGLAKQTVVVWQRRFVKKNDWQLGFLGIKGVDHWNFRWLKTEECALGSATVWNRGLFFIESGIWDSKSRCFTMIWYKYTNGRCDPTPCFSVRIASKTHVPIVPQMTWETNMWI